MALKSRLLISAFILPLTATLALAPASAFDIRDTAEDTPPVDTSATTGDLNGDGAHELASTGTIVIDGTPQSNSDAAVLVNSNGQSVLIDGDITIRDRDDDGDPTAISLGDAYGVRVTSNLPSAITLRLGSNTNIIINEVRGPNYDGDGDGLPDNNDSDEDGIIEGSPALAGTNTRIGLWIEGTINQDVIGEGGTINVDGNGARGVQIDGALSNNFDFSTALDAADGGILGDNAIGVDVNDTIGGYYRQRGNVDVRGEGSIGIDVGAAITGSLMIEGGINATGFSTYSGTGGPSHGRDESELESADRTANTNERRRGGAAVNVADDVIGGVIIGGLVNAVTIDGRVYRLKTDEEEAELQTISDARADDTIGNVAALATLPYQFDDNRASGNITTYGEAAGAASLTISSDIGAGAGSTSRGSVETLLDTSNDDEDDDTDIYAGTAYGGELKKFFYSHGLMNRGSIEANGLYDGFKADALLIDGGANVYGGIYNSGTISAVANNADAQAIVLDNATLNSGVRTDGSVLLNEGTISAAVSTHAGADDSLTAGSHTATAITLGSSTTLTPTSPATIPLLVNRGSIAASSAYVDTDGEGAAGENKIALNAADFSNDLNFTQEFLQSDDLLLVDASAPHSTYKAGGDTDIDVNGDGAIDTRDGIATPAITGDMLFGDGDNDITIKAGDMTGDISFGDGDDDLTLSNEIQDDIQDDADDDYTAPITTFTGRLTTGGGSLNVTIGDRTRLHLAGQEGRDINDDGDDTDTDEETEGLALSGLTLTDAADLRVTVDTDLLDDTLLDVTTLSLGDDATITPSLANLVTGDTTVKLIEYGSATGVDDINDHLGGEHPFIYKLQLVDSSNVIEANFSIKSGTELGLNRTEAAALTGVLAHFREDELRESRITGITDGDDFREAYGELFPHYSDGTAQQLAAMAEASTGAVSQHLQLVAAGGRRGGDGWVQQFGDFRKQDAATDNATVSGNSYGIAFGYDFPAGIIEAMGLYAQMSFTAVNEKSTGLNEVKSDGSAIGAYVADALGPIRVELNAAQGFHNMESTRRVEFNGLVDRVSAGWDANSTSASARFAYPIFQDEDMLRLEVGVDYFRLEHDDYSETDLVGRGFAMRLKNGESEKTSQFIGLRGGRRTGGGDPISISWEPNYYLGYRTVSDETPYTATANFVGASDTFRLQNFVETEDAVDVGLGIAAHNDYFAFEFNYRGQYADGVVTQGGGVSIRLLF